MHGKYLLDTNAYFNFMYKTSFRPEKSEEKSDSEVLKKIADSSCYISELSKIEIVSVIGKYARGVSGGREKCNCMISEKGEICGNYRYSPGRKPMKKSLTARWLKLIEETMNGNSSILNIKILPLSAEIVKRSEKIIRYALENKFGSQDAIIAATLETERIKDEMADMAMITSDKALKACLDKCGLPYWDAFKKGTY